MYMPKYLSKFVNHVTIKQYGFPSYVYLVGKVMESLRLKECTIDKRIICEDLSTAGIDTSSKVNPFMSHRYVNPMCSEIVISYQLWHVQISYNMYIKI